MKIRVVLMIAVLSLFAVAAVAADISGKWTSEQPGRDGTPMVTTYTFKVAGGTLTGTVSTARGDQEISEGKVSGDDISFVTVREGRDGTPQKTTFTGKVAGNEIKLTRSGGMGGGRGGAGGAGGPGAGGGAGGAGGAGGRGGGGPQEITLKRAS